MAIPTLLLNPIFLLPASHDRDQLRNELIAHNSPSSRMSIAPVARYTCDNSGLVHNKVQLLVWLELKVKVSASCLL